MDCRVLLVKVCGDHKANLRLVISIADQARTIRIPVHMIKTINKLNRIWRQMLQEMGREPTPKSDRCRT